MATGHRGAQRLRGRTVRSGHTTIEHTPGGYASEEFDIRNAESSRSIGSLTD